MIYQKKKIDINKNKRIQIVSNNKRNIILTNKTKESILSFSRKENLASFNDFLDIYTNSNYINNLNISESEKISILSRAKEDAYIILFLKQSTISSTTKEVPNKQLTGLKIVSEKPLEEAVSIYSKEEYSHESAEIEIGNCGYECDNLHYSRCPLAKRWIYAINPNDEYYSNDNPQYYIEPYTKLWF